MLNSGVLTFSVGGAVRTAVDPPLNFNGGTPMAADGLLSVAPQISGFNIDYVLGGLGYNVSGAIVTDSFNPVENWAGGLPMTSLGLAVEIDGVPDRYVAGIPISADGRVCIVVETPVVTRAFSNGFSSGFE